MPKNKKQKTSKIAALVLMILALGLMIYVANMKFSFFGVNKENKLQEVHKILTIDPIKNNVVEVNKEQIVHITNDGVAAYTKEGEEIWSETISFDNLFVRQREPYFIVAEKQGHHIVIFNDKGKQGQITCQNTIVSVSVNKNGYVAVIESAKDSHTVSIYDPTGKSAGVKRITYVEEWGFPVATEISQDNESMLIVYIDTSKPVLTSNVVCVPIKDPKNGQVDSLLFGFDEKDNFIYALQFINNKEWVAIGDQAISLYDLNGKKLWEKKDLHPVYIPYLNSIVEFGGGYLPILASEGSNTNAIHRKDTLYYFNVQGNETFKNTFEQGVDSIWAGDKGVIVGTGRDFYGYNKIGNQVFTYKATKDVTKLMYLKTHRQVVAVCKNEVLLLKSMRQEK